MYYIPKIHFGLAILKDEKKNTRNNWEVHGAIGIDLFTYKNCSGSSLNLNKF